MFYLLVFVVIGCSIELGFKPRFYFTYQKTIFLFYGRKTRNYIQIFKNGRK
jgi:hypothetical protein